MALSHREDMPLQLLATSKKHGVVAVALLVVGLAIVLLAAVVPVVSALLLAIVVGAIVGNLRVVPVRASGSISWASKKFLRVGIVLLGFKLSLVALAEIGIEGIAVLVITVATTFLGTLAIGRALRVPRVMRMLVATGFAICGASAVAAMSSVVDPEKKSEEDTALAVAMVTLFGTLAMFALPVLSVAFGLSDLHAGIWIGASVHEVAQVVAAGGMVSAAALALATLAKLGRVVLLAPLIAVVSAIESRATGTGTGTRLENRPPIVPLFVVGFLGAVLVRTFVPLPVELLGALEFTSTLLLTAAMLGLGFGVDIRKLIKTGWRPFALGALSTLLAAGTALALTLTLVS